MMLQLIIDGKQAALPADLEIEIQFNNFILEERKEDATYPLTLSLDVNRHIFGWPERINSNALKTEYSAQVLYAGYLQLDGNAYVTDINGTDKEVELYITTNNRSFWGVNSAKYIDEMDLGYEDNPDLLRLFNASVYGKCEYVCLQLYDPNYNDALRLPYFYNRWDAARQGLMQSFNGRANTYAPFPRLLSVIRWVVWACGYEIKLNDLERVEGFRDVLLVHRHSVGYTGRLNYREIVPHLTVREFFDEIERKFSVRLFIHEGSKGVFIRSSGGSTITDVTIFDGISKTLQEDKDIQKNYLFKDKEVEDGYVNIYRDRLKYLFGQDNEPETVECVSTIVGTNTREELVYMAGSNPDEGDHDSDIRIRYDELAIGWGKEASEFRLTVYRGFKNRAIAGPEENQELYGGVPIASPVPVADGDNSFSLLWAGADGLFEHFHRERVSVLANRTEQHEMNVVPGLENVANVQRLFSGYVVVNNRKYIVREQRVKLSTQEIVEHALTVYPV